MIMQFEDITTKLQQSAQRIREANRNAPIPCKFAVGDRVYFGDEHWLTQVIGIRFYAIADGSLSPGFWRIRVKYLDESAAFQARTADESQFIKTSFDDKFKHAHQTAIRSGIYQLICRSDWKLWFVDPKGTLWTTPVAGYADATEFYKTHIWGDTEYLKMQDAIAHQLTQH
jgi:hypothetical protein